MPDCKSKLCGLILLVAGITSLHAQEVIPVTGGNASGSGGSVSYSVGQIACFTINGINGSVAQGVQQTFEISVVSGIEEAKDITLQCSVYPNPATDFLILKIEGASEKQYISSLYAINGKLLENKKIDSNETRIDMRKLVAATYFLKVIQTKQTSSVAEVKTFKIIKN